MAVEVVDGAVIATGDDIGRIRLITLRAALKLEIIGMKMSRSRSISAILKSEFGFKGCKTQVLTQLEKLMTDRGIQLRG